MVAPQTSHAMEGTGPNVRKKCRRDRTRQFMTLKAWHDLLQSLAQIRLLHQGHATEMAKDSKESWRRIAMCTTGSGQHVG